MARISRADKDAKIIEENPNKSIHEYRLLGVSEQKLSELQALEDGKIKEQKPYSKPDEKKVAPVITSDNTPKRAQPIIKTPAFIRNDDMVVVIEIATGKRTRMRKVYAEKFTNKKTNKGKYHVEG